MTGPTPQARREDLELVRRVLAGENEATARFVERMGCVPRMVRSRNARMGAPLGEDELDDVVQETLVALWRKLDRFDGSSRLETWAYRFAWLEFLRKLRARSRGPVLVGARIEPEPENEDGGEGKAPEWHDHERVLRALERVPTEMAGCLQLKHLDGLTFDEIGERLGIPASTAKTRYYRGLRKLRELLGETSGDEGETDRP